MWSIVGYKSKSRGVLEGIFIVPNLPLQWNKVCVYYVFFSLHTIFEEVIAHFDLSFFNVYFTVWVVNIYVNQLLKLYYLINDYLCQ
jgi:hypothetical protein